MIHNHGFIQEVEFVIVESADDHRRPLHIFKCYPGPSSVLLLFDEFFTHAALELVFYKVLIAELPRNKQ